YAAIPPDTFGLAAVESQVCFQLFRVLFRAVPRRCKQLYSSFEPQAPLLRANWGISLNSITSEPVHNSGFRRSATLLMMISLFGKPEPTLLERLKTSVSKTKTALSETVDNIFLGEKQIDPAALKHLESTLLSADLGVRTTREILDSVKDKLDRNALSDTAQLKTEIKSHISRILRSPNGTSKELASANGNSNNEPRVIFIVGVNGVGKTTS